ncbi:HAD family hydrolase [Deinococcus yavapaiensis]|uniref:Putative hydrolase of the HAD superfamily n=1 Tax=Deinococcus yavapaiensis KR-236 TaxID=694435 RepID=A0A318SEG1_9DEIO|nr:putative hydrolase of the HAD superfamily [Deinococcus yavapaiensis KR-236]
MTTPPPNPSVKAVLFDRDDTLSLTDHDVYRQAAAWVARRFDLDGRFAANAMVTQWAETARAWQHLRTLKDEVQFWREYAEKLATHLGLHVRDAEAFLREWPYERFMMPVPGVRFVLGELRERGLKIGVLSNTLPNVEATLKAIGVDDLVDVVIASSTLGVHKPSSGRVSGVRRAARSTPERGAVRGRPRRERRSGPKRGHAGLADRSRQSAARRHPHPRSGPGSRMMRRV